MEAISEYKPTILLVDDTKINLIMLSDLLGDKYNIKVAKSGQKALEIAKQGGIDLILLDIVMPEMDGYAVCKALKEDSNTKSIPVIFVTASTTPEDEARGFEEGAVDYIMKPFVSTTVLARVHTHITFHLKQLQLEELSASLQEKNGELQRYIKLIDENIITSSTDIDGNITYASEAFVRISGYTKEEMLGQNHRLVRHEEMDEKVFEEMWNTVSNNQVWHGELKNKKKDGGFYWVEATISPLFDKDGQKIGYTAIRQDITDKKKIEEISITDPLTSLYNRRHFNEMFQQAINRAKRDSLFLNFVLLDIDHFKLYNDNYGHQKGDEALVEFAKTLQNSLERAGDMAFRLGGEEFGVLFHSDDSKKAFEYAQSICNKIEDMKIPHAYNSASSFLTASMGLMTLEAQEISEMDSIYKQADELLYKAKESGRNQVQSNTE